MKALQQACLLAVLAQLASGAACAGEAASQTFATPDIAVELRIDPPRENADARIELRLTDPATKTPLRGLRPAAWLDRQRGEQKEDCRAKVGSFIQGRLTNRADVDLNAYYLLSLNEQASVSVIDPLTGFGTTKELARVVLPSPGADWVLGPQGERLYISLPDTDQVAVVDTTRWKTLAPVAGLKQALRIALQPDRRYLWVSVAGGVAAIDADSRRVLARVATGEGPHQIAFSADSRRVFVANGGAGSVTVIDTAALRKLADIRTGARPVALAFAAAARTLHVAHDSGDGIAVIDVDTLRIAARIDTGALVALRFPPEGRHGLALDRRGGRALVVDAATNAVTHTLQVGPQPVEIAFTEEHAYIRLLGAEQVKLIALEALGGVGPPPLSEFPAGQRQPDAHRLPGGPAHIVPSIEPRTVVIANPVDKALYHYAEGMAAPMGSFRIWGQQPRGVLVLDRSLRETAPGVYTTSARLPERGSYDLALALGAPRLTHCFALEVQADPKAAAAAAVKPQVEYLLAERRIIPETPTRLSFRLTDAATDAPIAGRRDVEVMSVLTPGNWSARARARPVEDGSYEVTLRAPKTGTYYVFVASAGLKLPFNRLPALVLQAGAAESR